MIICTDCGCEMVERENRYYQYHESWPDCIRALQARAEAAEKMAGQWLQLVTLRDNLIFELEAQLAAQWRPVTEPPQMADNYHVWRRPGYHDFCHFNGVNWRTTGGDSVTHWQPLPAPPIDPPAPA